MELKLTLEQCDKQIAELQQANAKRQQESNAAIVQINMLMGYREARVEVDTFVKEEAEKAKPDLKVVDEKESKKEPKAS